MPRTSGPLLNRRSFITSLAAAAVAPRALARPRADTVVLYSSVDDYLIRDVIAAFEAAASITVKLAGDTEATKTTGLVHRLIAERERPRADVWWSNEPFGSIHLAAEDVLEPYTSKAEGDLPGGWPAWLRARDRTWYGHALRARCMARNTVRLAPDKAPARLRDLAAPEWKGRIGMARPDFGTTRGHMAFLLEQCGEGPLAAWLRALKANDVRLFDGNSAVVRALRMGEIDAGLTDTDDVLVAAQEENWPIAMCPEAADAASRAPAPPTPAAPTAEGTLCARAGMPIAATVARVKGGPNPAAAASLIDFLLSEKVEDLLAASPARLQPLRESVKRRHPQASAAGDAQGNGARVDFEAIARHVEPAMRLCRDILG